MIIARLLLVTLILFSGVAVASLQSVAVCGNSTYAYYSGKNPSIKNTSKVRNGKGEVIMYFSGKKVKYRKISSSTSNVLISKTKSGARMKVVGNVSKVLRLKSPKSMKIVFKSRLRNSKVISIDAGHGWADSGASYQGLKEKNLVLPYVNKLANKLKRLGYTVILTRPKKQLKKMKELQYRVSKSNKNNADLFISIHVNALKNKPSVRGIEIFYSGRKSKSFAGSLRGKLRRINKVKIKSSNFYVIKNTKSPAILLEVGFLSNYGDRKRIVDSKYIGYMVDSVVRTIKEKLPTTKRACRKFKIS